MIAVPTLEPAPHIAFCSSFRRTLNPEHGRSAVGAERPILVPSYIILIGYQGIPTRLSRIYVLRYVLRPWYRADSASTLARKKRDRLSTLYTAAIQSYTRWQGGGHRVRVHSHQGLRQLQPIRSPCQDVLYNGCSGVFFCRVCHLDFFIRVSTRLSTNEPTKAQRIFWSYCCRASTVNRIFTC